MGFFLGPQLFSDGHSHNSTLEVAVKATKTLEPRHDTWDCHRTADQLTPKTTPGLIGSPMTHMECLGNGYVDGTCGYSFRCLVLPTSLRGWGFLKK